MALHCIWFTPRPTSPSNKQGEERVQESKGKCTITSCFASFWGIERTFFIRPYSSGVILRTFVELKKERAEPSGGHVQNCSVFSFAASPGGHAWNYRKQRVIVDTRGFI
jgi:hypothetical protein